MIVLEAQLGLSDSMARLPSSSSSYRGTFGSRLSSILHNVFSPSGRYFLPEVVITGYASSRKNLCARNLALPFFSSVYRGRLCASGLAVSHLCCRLSINAWVIHNLTPLGIHVSDIHDHRGPASKRQRQMGGGGGGGGVGKRKRGKETSCRMSTTVVAEPVWCLLLRCWRIVEASESEASSIISSEGLQAFNGLKKIM